MKIKNSDEIKAMFHARLDAWFDGLTGQCDEESEFTAHAHSYGVSNTTGLADVETSTYVETKLPMVVRY